jgi:nucleotide-binding universal stress UspA family protein
MSAFKDLLVTIDASRDGRQRLAVAVELAQRSGAHLTGCYRALALEPTAASDLAETGQAGLPGMSHEGTLAETMEQRFRDDLARFDLKGDWLATGERALDDVVGRTRTVDLAIVGLGDPDRVEDNPQGFRPEELILAAGRPVLGIPIANVPERLGRTVLVAWEGSRAASRAMNDALPLLMASERVTVLSIGAEDQALPLAEAAASHLRRHGAAAEASRAADDDLGIGELILAHADRLNVDLVVAGAYGHSRMSHAILGGVSRTLLRQMMVPVLMSH